MVDDQLPRVPKGYTVGKRKSGQLIFAMSQDESELWVAILEKVFELDCIRYHNLCTVDLMRWSGVC